MANEFFKKLLETVDKKKFLEQATRLPGIYVPQFYDLQMESGQQT